ncbi:MAG TPA: cation:proton antiporter [Euryarchaeota archaeon]|nr:cation:proton antiporter [Euryarchaeota archaeon]
MRALKGFIPVALLTFVIYILFTGSATLFDIVTGIVVGIVCGVLFGRFLVEKDRKALNPARWLWTIIYFLKYMTIIEFKAHWDVIKRTITGNIRPGIVKVPIKVKNEYARILVANSITNTPGTVTVDMDDKYIYVNWINVVTEDPDAAKKHISEEFEKFAEKILE